MPAPTEQEPERVPRTVSTDRARLVASARSGLRRVGSRLGGGSSRQAWLIAPFAAVWAALIGFAVLALPLLLVWMATPQSGLTWVASLRVSGLLWVVAHGAPVAVAGTTYSLVPWGLAIVPVMLLGYAGGWAARRTGADTPRSVAGLVGLAAAVYALLACTGAVVVHGADADVSPVHALIAAAVIAVLAFGWGALRAAGLAAADLMPDWLTVILRGGLLGAMTLLGLGALAATASLLVHVDDAVTMSQSLHAGIGGGLGLLLAGVAYVPVLVVWATAYVVGAGIVIGPAVVVSPFIPVTAPTQLPPFPLLAALPTSTGPLAWALPLAGVLAGVLVGLAVARRARRESRLLRLTLAVGSAAVAGAIMMLLSYLASGSLGDLRLAHMGPSPLSVAVLTAILITLGAAPIAVVASPSDRPSLTVAPVDPDEATDVE